MLKQTVLSLAVALAFAGPAVAASDAHEHGHKAGEAKPGLNAGKKWQTDEPLRRGMENIRGALAADQKTIHASKQTPEQYDALATRVNAEVATIVKNCKLDKQADEQLHRVLADVLAGAETMQGKAQGEPRREGAERLAKALDAYGRLFEHPGWKRVHRNG